ncbi:HEAT repeat domain-containing protein [Nostoc sp. FACHB-152]|uniref:peptidoglycan-binding protein n=1 Tax=unclassified Nostoc TaxID=2593658 RepID=UPI001682C341|nr:MULTISPECIES: peptidoglycan-binding protein [unclassified Nostoc]MBD2445765.1 HEAT repeat domain-containing protein [Nostoc sp. FACHB-152]MBD2466879.1 HEAT repeat domain-containing protein [Nostoc sp. FACHB-145]
MRLCPSSILIFSCFTCVGLYPIHSSTAASNPASGEIAQVNSQQSAKPAVLKPSSQGTDVQRLQSKLKDLGFYKDAIDGKYSASTQLAVSQFQKAQNLKRIDGIADKATQARLQAALSLKNQFLISPIAASISPNPQSKATAKPQQKGFFWWSLLGLAFLGSAGALLFLFRKLRHFKKVSYPNSNTLALSAANENLATPSLSELENTPSQENTASETSSQAQSSLTPTVLPIEKTARLAKLNIVDELIKDLESADPTKRQKAIWDLGQQGDSRAIQPLMDLMIDADSQQRSLILGALSEISTRALKPINRALAISLQDESPQVRQNAIRDLTRVYDMMAQMSQMLSHAVEDPDAEVQATAKYALSQMKKVRGLPSQPNLPEDHQKDSGQSDL